MIETFILGMMEIIPLLTMMFFVIAIGLLAWFYYTLHLILLLLFKTIIKCCKKVYTTIYNLEETVEL